MHLNKYITSQISFKVLFLVIVFCVISSFSKSLFKSFEFSNELLSRISNLSKFSVKISILETCCFKVKASCKIFSYESNALKKQGSQFHDLYCKNWHYYWIWTMYAWRILYSSHKNLHLLLDCYWFLIFKKLNI